LITHDTKDPTDVVQDVIRAFKLKPHPNLPATLTEETHNEEANNPGSKNKTRYYSKKGNATRSRTVHDEHNEVCEVCDRGGDLLCCETCTLVYHLSCIRPKLSSMPKGTWSCPHCILDGSVSGDKVMARAAVTAMWNLELGLDSEDEAPLVPLRRPPGSKFGEEFDPDLELAEEMAFRDALRAKTVGEITVSHSSSKKYIVRQTAKRQIIELGRYNSLPDALASLPEQSLASVNSSSGMGHNTSPLDSSSNKKRGHPPSSSSSFSSASTLVGALGGSTGSMSPSAIHHGHGGTSPSAHITPLWCTQCIDSAHIQVCLFCGCTKCAGKIDSELLIMCDHCNRVVHTYCHDPPLNAIPSANPWFCEACRLLPSSVLYGEVAPEEQEHDHAEENGPEEDGYELGRDYEREFEEDAIARRKQRSDSLVSTASTTGSGTSNDPVKRGRGRPPGSGKKHLYSSVITLSSSTAAGSAGGLGWNAGGSGMNSGSLDRYAGGAHASNAASMAAGATRPNQLSSLVPSSFISSGGFVLQMKPSILPSLDSSVQTETQISTAALATINPQEQDKSKRLSGAKRSSTAADLSLSLPRSSSVATLDVGVATPVAETTAMDVDDEKTASESAESQEANETEVFSVANGLAVIAHMSHRLLRKEEEDWLNSWREFAHYKDVAQALKALFQKRDSLLEQLKDADVSAYEDMLRVYGPVDPDHDALLLSGQAKLTQSSQNQAKDDNSSMASSSANPLHSTDAPSNSNKKAKRLRTTKKTASSTVTAGSATAGSSVVGQADDDSFSFHHAFLDGDSTSAAASVVNAGLYAAYPLQRDLSVDSGSFSLSFDHEIDPPSPSHPSNSGPAVSVKQPMGAMGSHTDKSGLLSRSSSQSSNFRLSSLQFPSESPITASNSGNIYHNTSKSTTSHLHHGNAPNSVRNSQSGDDMLFTLSVSPLTTSLSNQMHQSASTGSLPSPPRLLPTAGGAGSTAGASNGSTPAAMTLSTSTSALSSLASSVTIMPSGTIVLTDIPLRHHLQPHQQQQLQHLQQSLSQSVLAQQQTSTSSTNSVHHNGSLVHSTSTTTVNTAAAAAATGSTNAATTTAAAAASSLSRQSQFPTTAGESS
jgi:hypothetical protein